MILRKAKSHSNSSQLGWLVADFSNIQIGNSGATSWSLKSLWSLFFLSFLGNCEYRMLDWNYSVLVKLEF